MVSTADRIATFGTSIPMAKAKSMAFWMISAFVSRSGAMLMAASVMNNGFG